MTRPSEIKRVLGLDIGIKRTGVAISDERHSIALPLTVFEADGKKAWTKKLGEILRGEPVERVVVGFPLNHHGEEGEDAQKIRKYLTLLKAIFEGPVVEWDERFTTVQAERTLLLADISREKRKQVIDKVAATIILQSYLDSLRFQSGRPKE